MLARDPRGRASDRSSPATPSPGNVSGVMMPIRTGSSPARLLTSSTTASRPGPRVSVAQRSRSSPWPPVRPTPRQQGRRKVPRPGRGCGSSLYRNQGDMQLLRFLCAATFLVLMRSDDADTGTRNTANGNGNSRQALGMVFDREVVDCAARTKLDERPRRCHRSVWRHSSGIPGGQESRSTWNGRPTSRAVRPHDLLGPGNEVVKSGAEAQTDTWLQQDQEVVQSGKPDSVALDCRVQGEV